MPGHSPTLDTLAQMRAQHFEHETRTRRQLALVAATLETDFEAHLRLEELQILPLLDKVLRPSVQSEIIKELRVRRLP